MIKIEPIPTKVFDTSIIKKNHIATLYLRTNTRLNEWDESLMGVITKVNKHSLIFKSYKYKTDIELTPEDFSIDSCYKLELIDN